MKKIKGLLLKDILQTKTYFITSILLVLLMTVLAFFQIVSIYYFEPGYGNEPGETMDQLSLLQNALNSSFFYFCIFPVYSCSAIALSFQQDEKCNFDKFAISSGISRKVIVNEKVIFAGVASIPGWLSALIISILISTLQNPYINFLVGFYILLISISGSLLANGVSLTLCTFLGSVKGRLWSAITTMLVFIAQTAAFVLYILFGLTNVLIGSLVALIFFGLSIAFFTGAYFLSQKAYSNKEF